MIPEPAERQPIAGTFALHAGTTVSTNEPSLLASSQRFCSDLLTYAGIVLQPAARLAATPPRGAVRVEIGEVEPVRATTGVRADGSTASGEHYRLTVTEAGVRVVGASAEGAQRGLTSLLHAAAAHAGSVPCMDVRDGPELAWRGLSLDVVRWFVPVAEVKRVIDVLALYKLNVLHLHLTDNEAWRLEIDGWPELTQQSSDGHYRTSELQELIAYGRERFVTVVPEIDLPGHAATALAAYPELGVASAAAGGVPLRIAHLDPKVDATWAFVEAVLSHVAALFPAPYLHLGGDEAFGMDRAEYVEFMDRAIAIAHRLGKRVVGWQETCRAGVGSDEVVQHWIDVAALASGSSSSSRPELPPEVLRALVDHFREAGGDLDRIAAKGSHLLLSPTTTFYLDQPHGDPSTDADQEAERSRLGLQLYAPRTLEQMLQWDIENAARGVAREKVAGVEAALWCETVRSARDLQLLLLPRIAGIAELAWNPSAPAPWAAHRQRLAAHASLWQRAGWSYYRAASVDWPSA